MRHLKLTIIILAITLLTFAAFTQKQAVLAMLSIGGQNKGLAGHWALGQESLIVTT